jgi:hypothetical protein
MMGNDVRMCKYAGMRMKRKCGPQALSLAAAKTSSWERGWKPENNPFNIINKKAGHKNLALSLVQF